MLFTTDQQTLDDLNIFGKPGGSSIYNIFNKTATSGGSVLLKEMFRYPLSDAKAINNRIGILKYFTSLQLQFPFDRAAFDITGQYLSNTDQRTKLSAVQRSAGYKLSSLIAGDIETALIHNGIIALAGLLKKLNLFITSLKMADGQPYHIDKVAILLLLNDPAFEAILQHNDKTKFSAAALAAHDEVFRFKKREEVKRLLQYIYEIDVYVTISKIAEERGFAFPVALPSGQQQLVTEGLYHPLVENAVANNIQINPQSNVVFLTGANMAGKSTFMKALTVAVYMAHMGFPVAASKMEFSVLNGIFTTINLPDDLGMGASHFYAEVLRAKKIANELQHKNLFIVFDELFRGTNVKDACEATIAFTAAFANKQESVFIVSTHIIEAGDVLKKHCENINFVCLPTLMEGDKPLYTYKLQQGISADRHGMVIINNEGILEILKEELSDTAEVTNSFITDSQTLADLNLLGKFKPNSIYSLFNKVKTAGGERLLQEMFHQPLTDAAAINSRSSIFAYFQQLNLDFPVKTETFVKAENYLSMGTAGNLPAATAGLLIKKLQGAILRDEQFDTLQSGLQAAVEMLNTFSDFIVSLAAQQAADPVNPYDTERRAIEKVFADPRLAWLKAERGGQPIALLKVVRYDYLLKCTLRDQMDAVLESLYRLDVYLSVTKVAKDRDFSYAEALSKTANLIQAKALWHPSLINGITNPLALAENGNMIFLTGANMAGKSTLMKASGIAVYLAHMGFPVAAREMKFSVRDGLYSSINVPDNIHLGYSHFYAEVLRVKAVAQEVASGKHLFVLFDELFKGTNVKDAFDGTLAVTTAFASHRNCFYVVSTHIVEVGNALQKGTAPIQFAYLPTIMEGTTPKYSYKIQQGITTDRQGMMIIENEGILDILKHEKRNLLS